MTYSHRKNPICISAILVSWENMEYIFYVGGIANQSGNNNKNICGGRKEN